MPGENVPMLDVVKLGVEGLHDRMDMIYFGMVLQKIKGVYGFTSEFACPVDVTVYADPAAGITEKMFEEAIDAVLSRDFARDLTVEERRMLRTMRRNLLER